MEAQHSFETSEYEEQGRTQGGGGAAELQPPLHNPQNWNLKNTNFADIMILRDLPFSWN